MFLFYTQPTIYHNSQIALNSLCNAWILVGLVMAANILVVTLAFKSPLIALVLFIVFWLLWCIWSWCFTPQARPAITISSSQQINQL